MSRKEAAIQKLLLSEQSKPLVVLMPLHILLADDSGVLQTTQYDLARKLRVTTKNVFELLQRAREAGYVRVVKKCRGGQGGNTYRIFF